MLDSFGDGSCRLVAGRAVVGTQRLGGGGLGVGHDLVLWPFTKFFALLLCARFRLRQACVDVYFLVMYFGGSAESRVRLLLFLNQMCAISRRAMDWPSDKNEM